MTRVWLLEKIDLDLKCILMPDEPGPELARVKRVCPRQIKTSKLCFVIPDYAAEVRGLNMEGLL